MDGLTATTKIIEALAWPGFFGGLIFFFRKELIKLLPNVILDYGNKTISVARKVEQIDAETKVLEDRATDLKLKIATPDTPQAEREIALTEYEQTVRGLQNLTDKRGALIRDVFGRWSPGRERIVMSLLERMPLEEVASMDPISLEIMFRHIVAAVNRNEVSGVNGGSLTALWSVGFIDEKHNLTAGGAAMLRIAAQEELLKRNLHSPQ